MKRIALAEKLKRKKILILDGSMSTALENLGCDLRDPLWTARVLANEPDKIRRVHLDYLRAGADAGITASYQASVRGLMEAGFSASQAEHLLVCSVRLFREAAEQWQEEQLSGLSLGKDHARHPSGNPMQVFDGRLEEDFESGADQPLCFGSCGPYGAYMHDGSEYRGDYHISMRELERFHKDRAEILWEEAGCDLLLFETEPSIDEARVEADVAEELEADYGVSFSCRDEVHICGGARIEDCVRIMTADHPHLRFLGVNCTAPKYIESLILAVRSQTDLPIAVYPNSGEQYDIRNGQWSGANPDPEYFKAYAETWMRAGAVMIGGCCRTTTREIRQCTEARDEYLRAPEHRIINQE